MKDTIIKIFLAAIIVFQLLCVIFQAAFGGYENTRAFLIDFLDHGTIAFISYVLLDLKRRK